MSNNLEYQTNNRFGEIVYQIHDNLDIPFSTHSENVFSKSKFPDSPVKFKDNEAPRPFSIDNRILKGSFNIVSEIFLHLANLCLSFRYFSLALRQGEVVYFLKQG